MIRQKLLTFSILLVCTIFFYSNAVGQNANRQIDIADISNNGANVSWIIKIPYESAMLTVSTPDGEVYQKSFKAGVTPVFSPTTERGEYIGDGTFTYQIVLTPVISRDIREALVQARIDGNSDKVRADFVKRGMLQPELIKSGTFTVKNGAVITGSDLDEEPDNIVERAEPGADTKTPPTDNLGGKDRPTPEDQQILDDLIVDGSACIGFDCVNGESFGFDTLRLKENNLRIKFQDTSTSASFPTNDWQLTANDTSNGGANKFSIDDIDGGRTPFTILAGAPSNSLFVHSSGRLGLGTSTPVVEIHSRNGDSPTLRLEQDGSSGFTAQTWDIAGNEANFFIRDVTNGSRLPFKIRPGAATDSFVIENNGDITIKNNLRVAGAASASYFFGGSGAIAPQDVANATVDLTNNAVGPTTGVVANVNASYNIPPSPNLAATNLNNVEYTIRYRDSDGTGNVDSRIRISVFSINATSGTLTSNQFFDSNSFGPSSANTVVVCGAVPAGFYDFANSGMYMNAVIQNKSAAGITQLFYVRIKRVASC